MRRYYCNCCGRYFSKKESDRYSESPDIITCPTCGAEREEDNDDIIEEYEV